MTSATDELDRVLTLLRNKIRERGFTQLEVQEALSWGRSYISQLLTKQKSLRVEQVLLILEVIGIEPGEFFGELYFFPHSGARAAGAEYSEARRSRTFEGSMVAEPGASYGGGENERSFKEVRSLLRGLARLLIDKNIIDEDDLTVMVKAAAEEQPIVDLDSSRNLAKD